jgi:6,7-dimethyl-8-ribityllumazine synthase
MIKSIHKLYVLRDEKRFNALVDFFDSFGLTRGESWLGKRSRGVRLEAPVSGIEIGMGHGFPDADLIVETDNADVVCDLARLRGYEIVSDVSAQDWGARLFVMQLPGDAGRVAVFSYDTQPKARETAGSLRADGKRFAIVVSRFNAFITDRLLAGALDALHRTGAERSDVEVVRVPGSFEIPVAARELANTRRFDAVICLGCLLRGETQHYEAIANEVTRGIGQSAQETGVPHAFGVLTCDTLEQAIDRAGLKTGNKGFETALSAVEMAGLKHAVAVSQIRRSGVTLSQRSSGRGTARQGNRPKPKTGPGRRKQ